MQFTLSIAAVAATVSANVLQPRAPAGCGSQITVSGGISGTLGQLSDGQNRIGPYPPATYYFTAGGFTDQSSRGCILTPPTTQFQCDVGARPTTGFAIGSNGAITSNGSPVFYACPANNGIYNIYTRAVPNQAKCVQVQLKAGNAQCYAAASSSSRYTNSTTPARSPVAPAPATTSSRPATTTIRTTSTQAPATQRPATSPATSPRAPASPVVANTCPPARTVTVTAAAAAAPARTVTVTAAAPPATTVTVCPSQAPAQTSARPAAPGSAAPARSSNRAMGPASSAAVSTSTRTIPVIATSSARPQTPSTSPRAVAPTPAPVLVSPSTAPRPVTSSSTRYTNTTRPATATTVRPASSCPALLSGAYQTPHLIVPVNSQSPARAYGTGYNGTVSPTITSDFNFDIPQSYAGKTCNLVFYFPTQAQLQTSSFSQSSNGGSVRFAQLSQVVNSGTTFQNQPPVSRDLGVRSVAPGNAYTISSGACPAGRTVSYSLSSVGGYSLNYFQDYNPCPIGLFITSS